MSEKTEFGDAIAAGTALCGHEQVGDMPYVVVPGDYKITNLEHYLTEPTRKKGAAEMRDAASFIAYYKAHEGETSAIYGSYDPPSFRAVFNDHSGAGAGWRDFYATYACPLSPEWKIWIAANGKQKIQADFALFMEDNNLDIVEPAAADMLLISRTLEAKSKVSFSSGIRLSNGEQELTYDEQIQGTAGKGKLTIPEQFVVGIPVFDGGPRYAVTCRLRYRINGGSLVMWYDILRPHKIVEDAVKAIWKQIEDGTGETIFNGQPA